MMQGGDPTGTGTGGESVWGKKFPDEPDSRLNHDARGVLSMANSGKVRTHEFLSYTSETPMDIEHQRVSIFYYVCPLPASQLQTYHIRTV